MPRSITERPSHRRQSSYLFSEMTITRIRRAILGHSVRLSASQARPSRPSFEAPLPVPWVAEMARWAGMGCWAVGSGLAGTGAGLRWMVAG